MTDEFKKLMSSLEQLEREKPEDVYEFIENKLREYISTYKSS